MTKFDVIIVGAGPAGSACARLLAQAGAKVLLLEKARFPREKSCGGLLSGKTLASIDAPLPDRLVLSKVHGMRMVAEDGKLQAESGHLPGRAVLVDRSQFDWWMVERACQAGAVYRDACEVVRIVNGREMATVYLIGGALVAKWVVGADGAASTVARTVGLRKAWRSWQSGITLCREWQSDTLPADQSGFAEMHAVGIPGALGWCFAWDGGWRIGVGAPAFFKPHLTETLDKLVKKITAMRGSISLLPVKTTGALVPTAAFWPRLGKERVFLAGDAAGLADPFSGEGIAAALQSGAAIAEVLSHGWPNPLQKYRAWWHNNYLRQRRLSTLLALTCWKKDARFFAEISRDRVWMDLLAGLMDGCSGYDALWHRTTRGCLGRMSSEVAGEIEVDMPAVK